MQLFMLNHGVLWMSLVAKDQGPMRFKTSKRETMSTSIISTRDNEGAIGNKCYAVKITSTS